MKPGPRPSAEIAARNSRWIEDHLAGDTPQAIAARASVSVSLVRKVLTDADALRRRVVQPKRQRASLPARGVNNRPPADEEERQTRAEARRLYMNKYIAERRLRPDVRAADRASMARYRAANRALLREKARETHVPVDAEERARRRRARGEARLLEMSAVLTGKTTDHDD